MDDDAPPSSDGPLFLAIEIGGTKLQLCTGTAEGVILERRRFDVDRAKGAEGIRQQLAACIPEMVELADPVAIGVGFGGPVDWRTGHVWRSYHLEGWSDFPLGSWLTKTTGLPTYADNDANVAALGEAMVRTEAGTDCDPLFYVTLGSGIGGGFIVGGEIYHGASPGEMEIGHLRRDGSGAVLEEECSGWSVDRRVREAAQQEPGGLLARAISREPKGGEAQHLAAALAAGDAQAQRVLREAAHPLGLALSHVIHLLHPKIVVLGGGLSLLGEPLCAAVEEALKPLVMDAFRNRYRIALSALGEDAVPVGALFLAALRHEISAELPS